ncbi:AMP-dependent synthetase/ligase domain-containing protein [Strongyloides ratti]|uniref:long-chain-fatty-acid--CoA ligase n=1 Tax=Strongyloides ratti TaxID=34506 RepID=A0A090L8N7_STRRB|nr:AMP-dependent synthetase/ligase domain-containing protein [Strongyloides ratti]CEF63855.1 AMP-dependent synthetase/ligase domain-containing protein [Strongyloides ratti]
MSVSKEKNPTEIVLSGTKSYPALALSALFHASFMVYDTLNFLPFKLFANPNLKLEQSSRIKGKNVGGEKYVIYRNVNVIGEDLRSVMFGNCDTIPKIWNRAVRIYGKKPAMGTRIVEEVINEKQSDGRDFQKIKQGPYEFLTFEECDEIIMNIEKGFKKLGVKKGDRVIIYAETRKEWFLTALACFRYGLLVVTVYATLGEEAVAHAINECEGDLLITTVNHLSIADKFIIKTPKIKNIIYFNERFKVNGSKNSPEFTKDINILRGKVNNIIDFDSFLSYGNDDEYISNEVTKDDLCMIMYTSGTTNNPKGVMLTHQNIVSAIKGQNDSFPVEESDVYIGYLPLAHIIEVCCELIFLANGCKVGYSSPLTLIDKAPKVLPGTKGDASELKPTILTAVPAIMNRIFKAVNDQLKEATTFSREIFKIFYERKRYRYENGYKSMFIDSFVFNKIKAILGSNVRLVLSGGAPLDAEIQRFMNICFCCPVIQGYGLTETVGAATISMYDDISTGYVGPPLTCAEIMLKSWDEAGYDAKNNPPQGEILISGPHVTPGYYKNEDLTNEAFTVIDGKRWFCTGDIGEFKEDGSLKIIDRKKDLVKLNHGEYISLGKVESKILTSEYVDNVCVYGNPQKDFVGALIVVNQKNITTLAKKIGIQNEKITEICNDKNVHEALLEELKQFLRGKLCRTEIPQRLWLLAEPWTPADGLLTEAMKLKRRAIESKFNDEIRKMMSL